jgi:hypothetical protein
VHRRGRSTAFRYATMGTSPAKLLPKETLLELLPASFEPWGSSSWYPSQPPTDASVQRIAAELRVEVPSLFIEIARACLSYGGWFGSIGDDFASHNHLLSINRAFREEGLTPRYVLLNHGHDGDCDAWDTEAERSTSGEMAIVYFNYDCDRRRLSGLRPSARTFAEYIDAFVRAHAPRCPEQGLRRRAEHILAAYGGTAVA